ncbi:MAG TPA: glycosyltransferase family 1 protein [Vicinamibacterales bacterium]|nr:glycosyltransferase family 1 protein [Vicinamibacterales bacterium]
MTPLRIGIDARELLGARTGVGRYLGELMARWTTRADAGMRQFLLFSPDPLGVAWPGAAARVLGGGGGTWWEQTTLAAAVRHDAPDVFFAPAYTAPVRLAAPLVVTIHDVSFSRHPEWFRFREQKRRHVLTRSAARRADVVLTVSQFSRQEIHDLYDVPLERIRVIRNGLAAAPRSTGGAREPLVLYSGSIFNRRRVPDLIAAFAMAAREVPSAQLVIAGDNRTFPLEDLPAIASAHGVSGRVSVRSYVSDEELVSLYRRASVFAFFSEYEGFGLTPLEALSAGVPVVVLDTPVAREIYGEAAVFVPQGDIAAAAASLTRLLTSPDAAAAQLARAPGVLARYSWDEAAEQTLSAIEGVARR